MVWQAEPLPGAGGKPQHPTACPPHRASTQHLHPTLVYRILGTFIFWVDGLPWLGLWAPPSHVALISTPKELQPLPELLGPRAPGWRAWKPGGPEPPARPGLHPLALTACSC